MLFGNLPRYRYYNFHRFRIFAPRGRCCFSLFNDLSGLVYNAVLDERSPEVDPDVCFHLIHSLSDIYASSHLSIDFMNGFSDMISFKRADEYSSSVFNKGMSLVGYRTYSQTN